MKRRKDTNIQLVHDDCLNWMKQQPDNCVDLVFGSPPYETARNYGIGFNLKGQDWVDWMVPRVAEAVRICKGLVAFVVEGQTRRFRWSATPALLMADLHRAGIHLRKPAVFYRVGIPGSGGPDWLRNDWEFIVCCTSGGKLPWSDNTAMGHRPKSLRCRKRSSWRRNGTKRLEWYRPPQKANPGNVIRSIVGGNHMGSTLAHKNEAPFPESLFEFFIRSFCPPGGTVVDPFSGSGTTIAAAAKLGRHSIGIDIRESQIALSRKRIEELNSKQHSHDSSKSGETST